jgi:hypothetical protein
MSLLGWDPNDDNDDDTRRKQKKHWKLYSKQQGNKVKHRVYMTKPLKVFGLFYLPG